MGRQHPCHWPAQPRERDQALQPWRQDAERRSHWPAHHGHPFGYDRRHYLGEAVHLCHPVPLELPVQRVQFGVWVSYEQDIEPAEDLDMGWGTALCVVPFLLSAVTSFLYWHNHDYNVKNVHKGEYCMPECCHSCCC